VLKLACVLSLVCLLSLPAPVAAQTRQRTTKRRTSTSTRGSTTSALNATALNEARLRVAEKIKVLTKFLYLYARTSKELEATETQARQGGQVPSQVAAVLDRNRATLKANLQNVRAGLDELELYFKTTPRTCPASPPAPPPPKIESPPTNSMPPAARCSMSSTG